MFRNTRATFCNLFRDHPTIILKYTLRNVSFYEFLFFENSFFDANCDDIPKIKNLEIFKIQRHLQKKYASDKKTVCTLGGYQSMVYPEKKRIRIIARTVLSVDGHMCVHPLTHI